MRHLVGALIVVTVIVVIALPLGWETDGEWTLSEPLPAAGAVRCPAALEWLGLGGEVEAAAEMPDACRGPLRTAAIAAGIGVVLSIIVMGVDRFFSHEATT